MSWSPDSIHIVNSVFRGSLGHRVNLMEIQAHLPLNLKGYKINLYTRRPYMLCIQRTGACLTLFSTGRFRVMGSYFTTAKVALQWFIFLTRGKYILKEPYLTLQTQTVRFKVSPHCAKVILAHYPQWVLYEPDIFTAIKVQRFKDVHINLFHTGNVIVLGRQAYKRALEVKPWLDKMSEEQLELPNNDSESWKRSPYEEAIIALHVQLPEPLRKRGKSYLSSFPRKLIFSWHRRLQKKDASLIPYLCQHIAQFSA